MVMTEKTHFFCNWCRSTYDMKYLGGKGGYLNSSYKCVNCVEKTIKKGLDVKR